MIESKKIWMDGQLINWKDAKIHVLTHTLHYGAGVFEGIRAYKTEKGPAVFRLPEHIKRFFYSASCIGMEIPFSEDDIRKAVLDTIVVNELDACYIRPLGFFGYGKMGLNPKGAPVHIAIAVWPWGAYLGEDAIVKVKSSKYMRIHPKSTVADAKICGHYVNSILASIEVKKMGGDEALLLDYEGYAAEGPGENIFMVKNGKMYTPLSGTILPGITRQSIIKIARDLNIETEEKKLTIEELQSADEAFFVGTAAEVCPIGEIDNAVINNGKLGEITKRIKEMYQKAITGKEEKYLNWLNFVNI